MPSKPELARLREESRAIAFIEIAEDDVGALQDRSQQLASSLKRFFPNVPPLDLQHVESEE